MFDPDGEWGEGLAMLSVPASVGTTLAEGAALINSIGISSAVSSASFAINIGSSEVPRLFSITQPIQLNLPQFAAPSFAFPSIPAISADVTSVASIGASTWQSNALGLVSQNLNMDFVRPFMSVWTMAIGLMSPGGGLGVGMELGAGRLASKSAYSVAYETVLAEGTYQGLSRAQHFKAANGALLKAIAKNPQLGIMMKDLGVAVKAGSRSPEGWTWHHAVQDATMQLVPRVQHGPGSAWQELLHPGGIGGMAIWGK